jgi:hypothetical protein
MQTITCWHLKASHKQKQALVFDVSYILAKWSVKGKSLCHT